MLQDLDNTLKELLNRELATELVQQIDFSFDIPSQESIGNKKTIFAQLPSQFVNCLRQQKI